MPGSASGVCSTALYKKIMDTGKHPLRNLGCGNALTIQSVIVRHKSNVKTNPDIISLRASPLAFDTGRASNHHLKWYS